MKRFLCLLITVVLSIGVYAQQTRPRLPSTTFANLDSGGSTANGVEVYCTDCAKNTDPCTSSGSGAIAQRVNGTWVCGASGSSPAGSDKYVQFNDGGVFGGDSGFTYDKTPKTVTLTKATNHGSISGSLTARNLSATNSPTATVSTLGTFNFSAVDSSVSVSGLTVGDSTSGSLNPNAYGTNSTVSGTMVINDTDGSGGVSPTLAPIRGAATVTTSVTAAADGVDGVVAGGYFTSSLTHSNNAGGALSVMGVYGEATGNLSTVGNHNHNGALLVASGAGKNNYGAQIAVFADATNNYGLLIENTLASGSTNYAIKSESDAQSVFAGPVTVAAFTTTGARNHLFTAVSTDITLGTHYFVTVDASGGNRTETLPTCDAGLSGRTYLIKKIDSSANTVTVARAGSDTIDGGTQLIFEYPGKARGLVCDGAGGWWVQ